MHFLKQSLATPFCNDVWKYTLNPNQRRKYSKTFKTSVNSAVLGGAQTPSTESSLSISTKKLYNFGTSTNQFYSFKQIEIILQLMQKISVFFIIHRNFRDASVSGTHFLFTLLGHFSKLNNKSFQVMSKLIS